MKIPRFISLHGRAHALKLTDGYSQRKIESDAWVLEGDDKIIQLVKSAIILPYNVTERRMTRPNRM
jgi:hypothetical protein